MTFIGQQTLENLKVLHLMHCQISDVKPDTWRTVALEELDLSSNLLTKFVVEWKLVVPALVKAKFDDNLLVRFDIQKCITGKLRSLSLSTNYLEEVLLPAIPTLETLDLCTPS